MTSSAQYEEILTTHLNDMYALAFQLTGSHHNAEDLVQDLFINLSMRQYQARDIERPKAWLATILYRTFVDQWRRHKRSPLVYGADETHALSATSHDVADTLSCEPEAEYERSQKCEQAMAILRQLNERHREIVILHDLHEYTMNEIAVIMALPVGTIKSNLHRARKHIALLLQALDKSNASKTAPTADKKESGNSPSSVSSCQQQAASVDFKSLQEILS